MRGAIRPSTLIPRDVQVEPIAPARPLNLLWNRSASCTATPRVAEITADVIWSSPTHVGIRNTTTTAAKTPAAAPFNVLLDLAPGAEPQDARLLATKWETPREARVTPNTKKTIQRPMEQCTANKGRGAERRENASAGHPDTVREQHVHGGQQCDQRRNRRQHLHVLGLPGVVAADGNDGSQHSRDWSERSLSPGASHTAQHDGREYGGKSDRDREQYAADPDRHQYNKNGDRGRDPASNRRLCSSGEYHLTYQVVTDVGASGDT